jgi:hypothetical protein
MAFSVRIPPAIDAKMDGWGLEPWLRQEVERHLREELAGDPEGKSREVSNPIPGRVYSFRVFDSAEIECNHIFIFLIDYDPDRPHIDLLDCGYATGMSSKPP